jgi:hypothetical protein
MKPSTKTWLVGILQHVAATLWESLCNERKLNPYGKKNIVPWKAQHHITVDGEIR